MKFKYSLRLLLLMLLFGTTRQMILRLPCGDIFAEFTIFIREKALNGSVIATISNTNDVQCMVKCVEHYKCRSYNTQIDEKKCELNSKAIGDKDAVLISKSGWVYKSTDYNATQVGDTCQELNPCHADILCRDKCDYPFYECVYCDESHYGLHCDKLKDLDECRNKPCKNNATCVDLKSSYSCKCIPGFTGVNCETEIDECDCLPCFNGGECKNEANKYSCKCASGYEGTNCEKDIDDCKGQPCQNGGGCVDKLNGYICNCVPGFKGTNCTININECSSNPCQNNATCNDAANGYSCGCLPGYKGMHCETNIDECNGDPCLNGGACTDGINEFTCKCALGYEGNTCNTNIDDCHSNPCQNGGKCKDLVNKFACECKAGSSGSLCEIDFDECSSNPCKNGATCVNGANQFTCTCLDGYEGKLCHPKCGTTITGNSGEIISKNYPRKYLNDQNCLWTVKVAVGSKIRAVFNDFELEAANCYYDFLLLFNGLLPSSPLLTGKLCGTSIPATTTTTGNNLLVKFVTDFQTRKRGFNLTWTVQP